MADRKEAEIILKGKFENGEQVVETTKRIDKNLKDIEGSAKNTEKQTRSLTSSLKKLGAVVGIAALANGFKNLVKSSLNAAGSMEQVNIALTTMLGSADKAAKLQKDLVEFAKKTPFEIEGIFDSTKQLLAYGFAQEEIISTMSTLGNIASGVGVDMGRLALVFGQVKTAGKLMGQDLLQFTGAGVPLLDALSETLGKSKAEVMALKEAGQISFNDVKVALESLTKEGGRFYNLMENQSKTFLGTVSNMSDSFYGVKVALGNALLPAAKRVVDFMVIKFGDLQSVIEKNSDKIRKFANAVIDTFSAIGKVLKPIVSLIINFAVGIKTLISQPIIKFLVGVTLALKGLRIALAILSFNPIVLSITAVITAIGYLVRNFDKLPNTIKIALLAATKPFIKFQSDVATVIDYIISKLALLSNVPGFGWTQKLSDSVGEMRSKVESDLRAIDQQINKLSDSRFKEGEVKTTVTQEVNQDVSQDVSKPSLSAVPSIAPKEETGESQRLKAAQDEYDGLLQAQKDYLGQHAANKKNADDLEAESDLMKQQNKLLKDQEYADRKRELDQMLLDDEITLDDYRREMQGLSNEAKLEALQAQYDAEREKFVENQTMMDEIKNEMQLTQDETELAMLQAKLDGIAQKQQMQNDKLIALKIKKDEADQKQMKKRGDFELKFEKFMSNEKMKGAQQAASQLVALQNSKNKQLAAIGKAAAIFQITTDTARGAMSAYSSLAPIPFVGPVLGAAAAAAVIAYGAERIGQVKSASYAVGTPDIPTDHMAMVHKGEMIIPATFADAIRSGDLSLSGGSTNNSQSSSQSISISFEGAAFYGNMDDEDIRYIGERLGELITENVITPIPTRRA